MADDSGLPGPGSEELRTLVPNAAVRIVYEILYSHRAEGISMLELRRLAEPRLAELGLADQQEQLDRRKRDLHEQFEIELVRHGKQVRHRLLRRKALPRMRREALSSKNEAIVLQPQRCAMCGRTPLGDGVKLVVDHKIPLEWGGTNELENLQPLCEEHNAGKKAYFATYDKYVDAIRQAMKYREPQKRIGELMKAFYPDPVQSDLISIVASAQQYQEDWQRRLRELRDLGWVIRSTRRKEGRRSQPYYQLIRFEPWPPGDIRDKIRRRRRGN